MNEQSESEFESARNKLRSRWELASVLNFIQVFEPVICSELKIDADEIEQSLILPDRRLRLLHVELLKGIPPVNRNLRDTDAWVVTLSKKLFMWWPWVAQGEFPLKSAKGAEMETYKNLDPTVRLVILKALCEIRADQHDAIAYINDAVKNTKEVSAFRKKNIGEDGKGTSYWLDGNETIGLRLYKEVNSLKENEKPPFRSYQWDTLATNLEEFQKVVEEYSSSKSKLEVAVSAVVGTQAIPILNKMFKKKQRQLERKMNEERIMKNFSRSGITRSCRNRNPIRYTFDEYDKVISEAIRDSKRLKTRDEQKSVKKENVAKEDPRQAGEAKCTESDENVGCEDSGQESDENVGSEDSGQESDENAGSEDSGQESAKKVVSNDSGEESDENVVSEDLGEESDVVSEASGEESDENVVSEASGEESDGNVVSEASGDESDENIASEAFGDESDENDEDTKVKMNLKSSKDRKMKSRDQQQIKKKEETEESEEDGETTGSDSDSKSSKLETKYISETDDDNEENTRIISKRNTKNADRLIQQKQHFGTKKRLIQRPNRNTALESAIVPDSEDEVSSENSDD